VAQCVRPDRKAAVGAKQLEAGNELIIAIEPLVGPRPSSPAGSVALPDRMIKAGLSCDLSDSFSFLVVANVGVCWVPIPA